MVVLVTGANGFVGRHLARTLLRSGRGVRALVRNPAAAEALEAAGAELVAGTLEDPASLARAVEGVERIVHLAALLAAPGAAAFRRVNVDGTERLLQASERAGVREFLLLSSLAATGPGVGGRRVEDTDPPRPVSHYGRTKRGGEERALARKDRFRVVVLRPPLIYGPGDRGVLPFFRCVAAGWMPLLGRVRRVSLLHVEDLVGAILAGLDAGLASGSVHHVSGDEDPATEDLLAEIGRALGVRPRRLRVPAVALLPLAALADLAAVAGHRAAVFGLDKWRELRPPAWVAEDRPFRERTGWRPGVPWREGIARTAAWYVENGWVRRRGQPWAAESER